MEIQNEWKPSAVPISSNFRPLGNNFGNGGTGGNSGNPGPNTGGNGSGGFIAVFENTGV